MPSAPWARFVLSTSFGKARGAYRSQLWAGSPGFPIVVGVCMLMGISHSDEPQCALCHLGRGCSGISHTVNCNNQITSPPPPPCISYKTITVPTPTVAWTRAWLARNTYNCRHTHAHMRRPHVLKWQFRTYGMHQTKKGNFWCTSRGPHVLKLANVTTNPCLMWPHYISYVIKLRTQFLRSLRLL